MCHGGTWAGDYVLNVIATGLSLKARGKRRRQRWVDDGRVLALGESRRSSAISVADVVASLTRDVADFPVPGVEFKDLTPLFADRRGLAAVTEALADRASGADLVAGVDARGFLVAAAVATRLEVGVLAVRKGGKLPRPVLSEEYYREYGAATLEILAEGIEVAGRRVVIIDDVLATGGTIGATRRLLERSRTPRSPAPFPLWLRTATRLCFRRPISPTACWPTRSDTRLLPAWRWSRRQRVRIPRVGPPIRHSITVSPNREHALRARAQPCRAHRRRPDSATRPVLPTTDSVAAEAV